MKQRIFHVLTTTLAISLMPAFCATAYAEPEVTYRYAELSEADNPPTIDARHFADKVEELSDGRIHIEVYDNAQLGAEKEAVQGTQMGSIDICRATVTLLADFQMPMLNVLGLPYMFMDRDHYWNVMNSEIGEEILSYPQEQGTGLVGLWVTEEGARSLITVDGPIKTLEDIKGKKIRANNASLMIDTVNAMGASAVPMAYTEVYTALKAGTIDGLENIPAGFNSTSMSEVAPYYAMTRHITSSMMIVMNEDAWNAMSEEDQEIFREASAETQEFARKTAEEYEEIALKELEEKGVMINEVDDIEEWAQALKPVTEKYSEGYEDLIAKIEEMKQE